MASSQYFQPERAYPEKAYGLVGAQSSFCLLGNRFFPDYDYEKHCYRTALFHSNLPKAFGIMS